MSHSNNRKSGALSGLVALAAAGWLATPAADAAAPGVSAVAAASGSNSTSTFNLNAGVAYNSQPDGELIYSWGYGCSGTATYTPTQFAAVGFCPTVQFPGPTLIVTEGAQGGAPTVVTVTLTNSLPAPAGNTSIVFPGLQVTSTCPSSGTALAPQQGLMTCEAVPGGSVTYQITLPYGSAGTHAYWSGTQPDLQVEMGLFGAVIVLPSTSYTSASSPSCTSSWSTYRQDYRLATSAYDTPLTCYDREYLWQWSEMDPRIHHDVETQIAQITSGCAGTNVTQNTAQVTCPTALDVATEPYHPNYFLINGRSMPDDMDPDYAPNYPNQPYNGNPHMHPGELVLIRTIGQGHWQHTFHEHGNHVRILGRDGNLLLAQANNPLGQTLLAGRMEFDTDTTPGQAFDGIFAWYGKGLGWDIYGHTQANTAANTNTQTANPTCSADVNGFFTAASPSPASIPTYNLAGTMISGSPNYYEWCADHNVPLEANPIGEVGKGGPATLMDPLVITNGLWYNGTPYLSQESVNRSRGFTPLPPGTALQNPPAESGIAFMWHSHNEREITTNDVFPGGMLMIMLVDPYMWNIDETL